jgi:hypothetical protein
MSVRQLSPVDDTTGREEAGGGTSGRREDEASSASDAALVAACREGDQGAWELLVRRYERLIFSVALLALYFDPAEPSYAQAARRLGRSAGGIGPMRARCLQRLRALLGEDAG